MNPKTLHEGEYLRLLRRGRWEYVERINAYGVATIVAVTDANELLLVEQYREPVARRVIELPAGLVGDRGKNETLIEAARRELIEETGYAARTMEAVCTGPVTSGLSNEVTTFCIARGLERVGPGGGDDTEDIAVHEVPLNGIDAWLATRPAEVAVDPKIHAGLYLLHRHRT